MSFRISVYIHYTYIYILYLAIGECVKCLKLKIGFDQVKIKYYLQCIYIYYTIIQSIKLNLNFSYRIKLHIIHRNNVKLLTTAMMREAPMNKQKEQSR